MTVAACSVVARHATMLRRTHSQAPVLDVHDLVIRGYAGSVSDFADASRPCSDFGQLIAESFDKGMAPEDWRLVEHPNTLRLVAAALMGLWQGQVLPAFTSRYSREP